MSEVPLYTRSAPCRAGGFPVLRRGRSHRQRRGRCSSPGARPSAPQSESDFFIDNLLVRIYCIIVMIKWTGRLNSLFQVALRLPSETGGVGDAALRMARGYRRASQPKGAFRVLRVVH